MAYQGQQHMIRLGQFGVISDIAEEDIPVGGLTRCENAQFLNGSLEKAEEILDWVQGNPDYETPTFSGEKPLAIHRYYPFPQIERHISVADSGRVYKYKTSLSREEVTPDGDAQDLLSIENQPIIVSGGNEVQGRPKKVFIFTGNTQVQVIEGDGNTRRNITTPAADWSTDYPSFGLIFRNRLVCFGNINNPHTAYISASDDQENFNALSPGFVQIPCYPGEGEGLVSAFIYKTKLFVFKKPYGVYVLVDTDNDPANWYFNKVSSSLGIAAPKSFFEATDDMFILSSDGAVVSMSAAFRLGDVYNADVLSGVKAATSFRNVIRNQFLQRSFGRYLPKKKVGIFAFPSYKSKDGYCDSLIYIDFNSTSPRISWHRYNSSEFTACDLFKDEYGDDQFLFCKLYFDGSDFDYGKLATTFPNRSSETPFRLQTPHSDCGYKGNKIFDQFELIYESTTSFPLAIDIYIDSKFSQTILVQPFFGGVLGDNELPVSGKFASPLFELDKNYGDGRGTRPKLRAITGRGQTISFVIRDGETIDGNGKALPDDDSGRPEPKSITGVRVYFSVAGQDQKKQNN